MNDHGLNQRQLLFAQGVLSGKPFTQAAIDAGYAARNAESQGSHLSRNPKVVAYIAEHNTKTQKRVMLTREEAVGHMLDIVEGKHKENGKADAQARVAAYDKVAKTLGFYEPEKLEVTGSWVDRIRNRRKQED